jgi:DNA (cytosine-5)-methyltransferase 1
MCEIDPIARRILERRFPNVPLHDDVRSLRRLPRVDLVAAGFPCQDLSQAGRTRGIEGANSSLVGELFRLVDGMRRKPEWILLENVPFMLRLGRGRAIGHILSALEDRGYRWAYRIIDTRAFGLPQRRERVFILASRREDPRSVLLVDDEPSVDASPMGSAVFGFYWTEGRTGVGWASDAVPPLKGGSGVGIPSPPGIWFPRARFVGTPDIRDAERLQGFPADWTDVPEGGRAGARSRWRLVGNAVSVPVAEWIGGRLASPGVFDARHATAIDHGAGWPKAAWGAKGRIHACAASTFPVASPPIALAAFLAYPVSPLSARATMGFASRARASSLRFDPNFLDDLEHHARRMCDPRIPVSGSFGTEMAA